jgi:hypothetical protein
MDGFYTNDVCRRHDLRGSSISAENRPCHGPRATSLTLLHRKSTVSASRVRASGANPIRSSSIESQDSRTLSGQKSTKQKSSKQFCSRCLQLERFLIALTNLKRRLELADRVGHGAASPVMTFGAIIAG